MQVVTGIEEHKGVCNMQVVTGIEEHKGVSNMQVVTGIEEHKGVSNMQVITGIEEHKGVSNMQVVTGIEEHKGVSNMQVLIILCSSFLDSIINAGTDIPEKLVAVQFNLTKQSQHSTRSSAIGSSIHIKMNFLKLTHNNQNILFFFSFIILSRNRFSLY